MRREGLDCGWVGVVVFIGVQVLVGPGGGSGVFFFRILPVCNCPQSPWLLATYVVPSA